ncbi:PepSY-associated TM helix domain-containing protein [Pseudonocardia acaciae]|uniref:PepSY-associated TM helix domain-containing protein n=1 Tax=Pseudonocardia acaciae TaxID=551276 RepID=UPI00048B8373|nr:PepSY-associated TM helix domain-containing protein [Pseudonocardia acaciae]
MSSELIVTEGDPAGAPDGPPRRRPVRRVRRPHGPINRWWIRIHRWTSLVLGLLLLLECTSGAVLLYGNDIARAAHPERYVATPSASPMSQIDALRMVRATHPELAANGVQEYEGIYLVRGPANSRDYLDAFVDPGSGRINGIGPELPDFVLFMLNIHDYGLTGKGMPGYQAWLKTPLPEAFGKNATLGYYLLGVLGALLVLLAVSGAVVWWPGLRALATGFLVRRGRGGYVRDLDLHRVVGIVAVPFLLMWGVTGAAFFFEWPAQAYFALVPGEAREDPPDPARGGGPMLSFEQARDAALAAHPGAEVAGFTASKVDQPGGAYSFRLRHDFDPYRYWNWSGPISVTVDSHGGGVQDWAPEGPDVPATQRLWDGGFYYGLHFGTLVSPVPRVVFLLFGLAPVLLGVTGVTVWLTKRRGARNRRQRAPRAP